MSNYIVKFWYGAPTYVEAVLREYNEGHDLLQHNYDLRRMGCKQLSDLIEYLKGWRKKTRLKTHKKEFGKCSLFITMSRDDAHYQIEATRDGYNSTGVVASGMMKDFD